MANSESTIVNEEAKAATKTVDYNHAVELYKAKRYEEVLSSLGSSVSLNSINSTDSNDEESLYLISYVKLKAFDSNYDEALKYVNFLRPIDNVLTPDEILEIMDAYPILQAAVGSTLAGEQYNAQQQQHDAQQQELKDRRARGIVIGMSTDDVLLSSWGKPKDINKTTTKYGVSEQWVYDDNRYVYFDDGIVTAIHE
ncbi:hypothetical protein [Paenibacillus sp. MMO-177]|uniref:hypothetical protein n=1 Tax=Paenibacillus sp. MMO-177 TaxID=3081289 RepID=UPI0030186072